MCVCACACLYPYCAEMMMGIKVCSRDTEGEMWRLRWVSRYSYIRHREVIKDN